MLSYRHAFHAGNHADIFKHLCLSLVLNKLLQKAKPLTYMDTHAAAGLYQLTSAMAQKTGEHASGVSKLLNTPNLPDTFNSFTSLIAPFFQQQQYPGSPSIAAKLLRDSDRLQLLELHNTEIEQLQKNLGRDRRVSVHHRDGYEGALALSPPTPRRGLILIDPPYEQAREYDQVVGFIKDIHRKWPVAVIALWYPLLGRERNRANELIERIQKNQPASLYQAELWVEPQSDDYGMHGSGMAFINLPWQADSEISGCLEPLSQILGGNTGGWRQEWLIDQA